MPTTTPSSEFDAATKDSRVGTVYYTFAYTFGHNIDNASGFEQRNSLCPLTRQMLFVRPETATSANASASAGMDLPLDRVWDPDQSASPKVGASIHRDLAHRIHL